LTTDAAGLGGYLRAWRRRRRMSQADLARAASISARHLGLMETGRFRPSRQMLLHLASLLDVPLRDRNVLLNAAGFTAAFVERGLADPALDSIRCGLEAVLAAHDPNPAMVVDRHWTLLAANRAVAHLVAGADKLLLRPPLNLLRLTLHPVGLAPRIVNLRQWREHAMSRLRRQIDRTGDPVLMDLLREIGDYPQPACSASLDEAAVEVAAIPFRLATIDGVLSFFGTTMHFAAPLDITISELMVEAFLPEDAETARIMRRLARQQEPSRDVRAAAVAEPVLVA
jgi:transcriptional regulator with XRE-family HTH domain